MDSQSGSSTTVFQNFPNFGFCAKVKPENVKKQGRELTANATYIWRHLGIRIRATLDMYSLLDTVPFRLHPRNSLFLVQMNFSNYFNIKNGMVVGKGSSI